MTQSTVKEAQAMLTHRVGLHARPAVKLTQLAARFSSDVHLRAGENGAWIDAKSIVQVMKLKARTNATLYFRARGADAAEAVRQLAILVERDFDEPPR